MIRVTVGTSLPRLFTFCFILLLNWVKSIREMATNIYVLCVFGDCYSIVRLGWLIRVIPWSLFVRFGLLLGFLFFFSRSIKSNHAVIPWAFHLGKDKTSNICSDVYVETEPLENIQKTPSSHMKYIEQLRNFEKKWGTKRKE